MFSELKKSLASACELLADEKIPEAVEMLKNAEKCLHNTEEVVQSEQANMKAEQEILKKSYDDVMVEKEKIDALDRKIDAFQKQYNDDMEGLADAIATIIKATKTVPSHQNVDESGSDTQENDNRSPLVKKLSELA